MDNLTSILMLFYLVVIGLSPSKIQSQITKKPTNPHPPTKHDFNIIDSCWRKNVNWANTRQSLANCAIGFGHGAIGGQKGQIYIVHDTSDDPINPNPGTLRYGATRAEPLWITFAKDMVITLKKELLVNSHKTIDGRGAKIEIAHGPCITMERVHNVIIHGLIIHDCRPGAPGLVRDRPDHMMQINGHDGDGIVVIQSFNVWIDRCHFASCGDGLIDVIHGSTNITISNSHFNDHKKVMLLGHSDTYDLDKVMKVTIVLNHFGPRLRERIPRVRYGYAHVVNNMYEPWENYAIGGSSDSTILSESNYFHASNEHKEVTKRETNDDWKKWKWMSVNDVFINGAFFRPSGLTNDVPRPSYSQTQQFKVAEGSLVPGLTSNAGALLCVPGKLC
ncbi:hypothetical protein ACJIZ3_006639 [Penstemon smallii]|uniref:Pectate lyase n=1 Tax=Penstemon smallii TaxID=265156 RepID=A0ABD3S895_9LAMI